VDLLVLWLLGPSVEGYLGRMRFFGLCLLGGLFALATCALAGGGASASALFAVTGATTVVLGGYLLLYPRAHVLTLVTVPFFMTIVEVPAAIVVGLWVALQLSLGVSALG
jgi:membrane associated rhomboid family serine protease